MDIAEWLRSLDLAQYAQAFAENDIDAEVLSELSEADLEKIGVSLGHRKKLLKAITALDPPRSQHTAPPPTEPPPAARPVIEAERRHLTVLFCDLVGSTALADRLDPEDMRDVIQAYQQTVAREIARFEGHIAKFMGDGVLAYFGFPRAHEDEAERAARSALALVDAVGRLGAPDGTALAARVGIATGPVVVGELIGEGAVQEEAVIGATPNLAARLQALAEPGQVVISPATRRLLAGLFELADLGRLTLKGFAAPVQAWRVEGESAAESRFDARVGRTLAPMVGRKHELALLEELWCKAASGEGQVVLLSGDAGIGKSRLIQAVRAQLKQHSTCISYQCSPFHQKSALHPVITQLTRASGIAQDDPPKVKLDKLERLLAEGVDQSESVAPLLAALLSVPADERYGPLNLSSQRKKELTLEALVQQLSGLAARRPVLWVFEDIHWIDPTSLELLDRVVEQIPRLPALAVFSYRLEFQPPWTGLAQVTSLILSRLGRREGTELVLHLTRGRALPAAVLDQILQKTDGVPLFVEELTKTVLESESIASASGRERAGPTPSPLAIPETLQDSLAARLDHLATVKDVAQIGSTIGREFSYELLAAVAQRDEKTILDALDQLMRAELVFARGRPPYATYMFKHALVQDAAYATMLRSRRHQLHARIVHVLEQQFAEVTEQEPETVAQHCAAAGLSMKAVDYWQRAGERANDRSANAEAESHLNKALELIRTLPAGVERQQREVSALTVLGRVLTAKSGYGNPEVEQVYSRARHLCDVMPGDVNLFPVLLGLAIYSAVRSELDVGLELSDRLLDLARHKNDRTWLVEAHYARGITHAWRGDFEEAHQHLELASRTYRPERHRAHLALYGQDPGPICLCRWSAVLWALGYPEQAVACMDEALSLIERLAHPFSSAYVLTWSAWLRIFRREVDEAAPRIDRALTFATEQAYPFWAAMAIEQEGWLLAQQGQKEQASERLKEGLARMQAAGTQATRPYTMGLLGEVSADLGRSADGIRLLGEALDNVNRSQERWCEPELLRLHGATCLAAGPPDRAAAENSFRQAIQRSHEQGAKSWELRAATSLARLWGEQGERQKAYDLLAPIYGWFTEGLETPDLIEAKHLLDELS